MKLCNSGLSFVNVNNRLHVCRYVCACSMCVCPMLCEKITCAPVSKQANKTPRCWHMEPQTQPRPPRSDPQSLDLMFRSLSAITINWYKPPRNIQRYKTHPIQAALPLAATYTHFTGCPPRCLLRIKRDRHKFLLSTVALRFRYVMLHTHRDPGALRTASIPRFLPIQPPPPPLRRSDTPGRMGR